VIGEVSDVSVRNCQSTTIKERPFKRKRDLVSAGGRSIEKAISSQRPRETEKSFKGQSLCQGGGGTFRKKNVQRGRVQVYEAIGLKNGVGREPKGEKKKGGKNRKRKTLVVFSMGVRYDASASSKDGGRQRKGNRKTSQVAARGGKWKLGQQRNAD